VQKLKDARTEASKEIEEYKQAKEREFKAFEASVSPESTSALCPIFSFCTAARRHNGQRTDSSG
jgi:hypothetical protein